jgi:hypothetical protein
VPQSENVIYEPPYAIITGISICPCIAGDGEHLPTAIIFDTSYDMKPPDVHKSTDFRLLLIMLFNISMFFV